MDDIDSSLSSGRNAWPFCTGIPFHYASHCSISLFPTPPPPPPPANTGAPTADIEIGPSRAPERSTSNQLDVPEN
ncbi:hypothetical protein TYRP_004880 [Tyrophagus putrescentiae]|nr:hypothetical protein TYRP_004880 [Tyrophagus putrescentiae]